MTRSEPLHPDAPPLERLLACEHEPAHVAIADAIWEAASDADAVAALERLAVAELPGWQSAAREGEDAVAEG